MWLEKTEIVCVAFAKPNSAVFGGGKKITAPN
jgi:hypothetical protein